MLCPTQEFKYIHSDITVRHDLYKLLYQLGCIRVTKTYVAIVTVRFH
jgi:hypothetical protein